MKRRQDMKDMKKISIGKSNRADGVELMIVDEFNVIVRFIEKKLPAPDALQRYVPYYACDYHATDAHQDSHEQIDRVIV